MWNGVFGQLAGILSKIPIFFVSKDVEKWVTSFRTYAHKEEFPSLGHLQSLSTISCRKISSALA
jgi:hypothetical protein